MGRKSEYVYICPNCGKSFESDKGFKEVKLCKKCGHKFASTVLFEE